MATEDQWHEVGERCAAAVVALGRMRAMIESNRLLAEQMYRVARSSSADVPDAPPREPSESLDARLALVVRALWGCGHAWFRSSRQVRELTHPAITPALAAGYDEHAVGIGTLLASSLPGGPEKMSRHTGEVLRQAMVESRRAIRALRAVQDPTLDIVADDLAEVVREIAGGPDTEPPAPSI
jgi:hypothetical protein